MREPVQRFSLRTADRVDSLGGQSFQGRENLERAYADLFNSRYTGGTLVTGANGREAAIRPNKRSKSSNKPPLK